MAIKANLLIDQGSTFATSITITNDAGEPVDLTGYTGAGQMRRHYSSLTYIPLTINISANVGIVGITLSADQTTAIAAGRYVYDVELTTAAGVVSRIVEGVATVTPQVTR